VASYEVDTAIPCNLTKEFAVMTKAYR